MNTHVKKTFSFVSTSDTLVVIDPCYKEAFLGGLGFFRSVPGTWTVELEYDEEGNPCRLQAKHEHYDSARHRFKGLSFVAVDSGQVGVFPADRWPRGDGSYKDKSSPYGAICDITGSDDRAGVWNGSFVTSTQYGDGCYDITTHMDGQDKVMLINVFLGYDRHDADDDD